MIVSLQSLSTGQRPGAEVFPRGRLPPLRFHGSPGSLWLLRHRRCGQAQLPGSLELRPRRFYQGDNPGRLRYAPSSSSSHFSSPLLFPSTQTGRVERCWGPALTRDWMLAAPMPRMTGSIALVWSSCRPGGRQMCRRWPSCCRNSWRPSTKRSSKKCVCAPPINSCARDSSELSWIRLDLSEPQPK